MNKQELIERIDKLPYFEGPIADTVTVNRGWILKSIEQLDEQQKPVVPQFVADWYEENKENFETNLLDCIYEIFKNQNNKLSEFEEWVCDYGTKPFQTLVNMHQLGYTVEKEKRYLVKMKGVEKDFNFLSMIRDKKVWVLSSLKEDMLFRTKHTRKELEEAGFGEVFNSSLFEVEEVEE